MLHITDLRQILFNIQQDRSERRRFAREGSSGKPERQTAKDEKCETRDLSAQSPPISGKDCPKNRTRQRIFEKDLLFECMLQEDGLRSGARWHWGVGATQFCADRRIQLRVSSEVHSAEHEAFVIRALFENVIDVNAQWLDESLELRWKDEHSVGILDHFALGKNLELRFVDRVVQIDECLIQPFGNVCGMNRIRRRPAENIVLQMLRKLADVAAKSRDVIALRHEDICRESHAQRFLRVPDLTL